MELLATGKIRGTFGLDGFVKVESFSGEYEHFLNFKTVLIKFLKKRTDDRKEAWFELDEVRLRTKDALFKFRGIDSPELAKELVGSEIFITRDMAPALNEGEVYVSDLCNCVLVNKGTLIGKITSVAEGGGAYLLEISEAATGRTVYIPYNSEFIGNVDLKAKTVELMHLWILE